MKHGRHRVIPEKPVSRRVLPLITPGAYRESNMQITENALIERKIELERERDQLLAELNLRIGAIRTVDEMLVMLKTPEPQPEKKDAVK